MNSKLVFLFILISFNTSVLACSCAKSEIEDAYENFDYIFKGKVTSVEPSNKSSFNKIKFDVYHSYKGPESNIRDVFSHQSGATCGYSFELGSEYIVFSFKGNKEWEKIGIALDEKPMVSLCSLTQPLNVVDKQLINTIRFLDNVKNDS